MCLQKKEVQLCLRFKVLAAKHIKNNTSRLNTVYKPCHWKMWCAIDRGVNICTHDVCIWFCASVFWVLQVNTQYTRDLCLRDTVETSLPCCLSVSKVKHLTKQKRQKIIFKIALWFRFENNMIHYDNPLPLQSPRRLGLSVV